MCLCTDRSKRNRWLALAIVCSAAVAAGQDLAAEAWRLESTGDAEQALRRLRQAATSASNDPVPLRAYAEFLDRHHDPAAREAYGRLAQALQRTNAPAEQRAAVAQRLAVLELLAGNREAYDRHLSAPAGAWSRARPWEKSNDCSRATDVISEIKMIAARVIEIDGALYQTQTQGLGVEIEIRLRVCRDRGDVMDAGAAHGVLRRRKRNAPREFSDEFLHL